MKYLSSSVAITIAYYCMALLAQCSTRRTVVSAAVTSSAQLRSPKTSSNNNKYDSNDMLDDEQTKEKLSNSWFVGNGREFDLFDTRAGDQQQEQSQNQNDHQNISTKQQSRSRTSPPRYYSSVYGGASNMYSSSIPSSSRRYRSSTSSSSSSSNDRNNNLFQKTQNWWSNKVAPGIKNWPKLQIRVEPTTTIKIRKTFRPLKTIVRLGADFNTQLGVWQFKSSWEDDIIGGKLTLNGRELQITKSWQLSVGAMEDLVTRLRFRAAVDLGTMKAYARVGFRTERLSPISFTEGFTIVKRLPIVGKDGKTKLEVKANFALPEPEIEYSTENQRSMVGMGDIEVNIEELNLVLDY